MVEAIQNYHPLQENNSLFVITSQLSKVKSGLCRAGKTPCFVGLLGFLWPRCLEKVPKHGYPKWLLFNGDFPWYNP